jgi:hypothetical protein
MSEDTIEYFWQRKFLRKGFHPDTAKLFAHTIEYKSQLLKGKHPGELAAYLRSESEKTSKQYTTKTLLELLGRRSPQSEPDE